MNVGVANVEPVIKSVLKHVGGFEVQTLHSPITLMQVLTKINSDRNKGTS